MTKLSMLTTTNADAAALYRMSIDDIEDRLTAMQHQESAPCYRRTDYLNCPRRDSQEDEGHRSSRSKMCNWSFQLADVTSLSRLAVSRSMHYLDRFVAREGRALMNDAREYQLAAMTSLYIAIKLYEPLSMDAGLLAEISAGCYTTKEILNMEKRILEALKWRMNGPTSQEFACLLLGLLNPEGYDYDLHTLACLLDVSKFQCELATADYDLSMKCKPSVVALAAILNSLDGMDDELLSSTSQYAFLTRMCNMMPSVNMAQVGFAQARLRQLFCLNSGIGLELPMSSSQQTISRSEEDCNKAAVLKNSSGKMDQVSCQVKCPSPVAVVTAPQRPHPDNGQVRFAKCA